MQYNSNSFLILFLFLFLVIQGCSSKKNVVLVSELNQYMITTDGIDESGNCNDVEAYSPCLLKEFIPTKFIRVNFHFMNTQDKSNNYNLEQSQDLVKKLLRNANLRLKSNHKMNLPVGNETPICPPHYQYVLWGDNSQQSIYHHYDDEFCFFANKGKHRNNYDYQVIEKYAVNLDSVINIFVMPHIPKKMQDNNYKESRTGVALGNGLKIAGLYKSKKKAWEVATLLNHEIGHILGLRHTWSSNDGCDDTPYHPNCWSSSDKGGCATASNNAMDYNNSQMAWTPCQLGRIHQAFNKAGSTQRKLLIPNWCDKDQTPLLIKEDIIWSHALDVNQDIIIQSGNTLDMRCRVHMAKQTSITIEPGATLRLNGAHLHNDCGDNWVGIRILSKRKNTGQLIATPNSIIEHIEETI